MAGFVKQNYTYEFLRKKLPTIGLKIYGVKIKDILDESYRGIFFFFFLSFSWNIKSRRRFLYYSFEQVLT